MKTCSDWIGMVFFVGGKQIENESGFIFFRQAFVTRLCYSPPRWCLWKVAFIPISLMPGAILVTWIRFRRELVRTRSRGV
jgi:hypothetical protein